MYEITDNLYYGGLEDAGDSAPYREREIEHVIQLTYEPPGSGYPKDVEVHTFSMMDGPQNDEATFRAAVSKIVEILEANATVLVHCSAGRSRSVCVAAAALGQFEQLSFEEAFAQVEEVGPVSAHEALRVRAETYCTD